MRIKFKLTQKLNFNQNQPSNAQNTTRRQNSNMHLSLYSTCNNPLIVLHIIRNVFNNEPITQMN